MTRRITSLFCVLPLLLAGCDRVFNFADDVGSHLPTIGERCEHWQCFTEEGRAQSEMKQRMRAMASQPQPGQQAAPAAASGRKPVPQNPYGGNDAPPRTNASPYGNAAQSANPAGPKPLMDWPDEAGQ